MMTSNGGGRYTSERRLCEVCKRTVSKARYYKHTQSKAHRAALEERR